MAHNTRSAVALIRLLKRSGVENVPERLIVQRTRAGHIQQSAGAWSWCAYTVNGLGCLEREYCASQWPLWQLTPLKKVGVYTGPPFSDVNAHGLATLELFPPEDAFPLKERNIPKHPRPRPPSNVAALLKKHVLKET